MATIERAAGVQLQERKRSHLDLCGDEEVEHRLKGTLFDDVDLIHNALPDLSVDELDLSVEFVGKRLAAPFLITGMTGGTPEAFSVNRDLATVAERCGVAFGLGSQRVMQADPSTAWTFAVREFAPNVPLLANIGLTQAAVQSTARLRELVRHVEADALCVHLNPAQELIQPEGDRDFRRGTETLRRLCGEIGIPVVVKETGCGISPQVAARLADAGVSYADVSGAGGTSWVRVEALRGDTRSRRLGHELAGWGIPTAACLAMLRGTGLPLIASGGLRTGVEMAKAIALGARICGAALPLYRAYREAGIDAALARMEDFLSGFESVMLLTGSRTLDDLRGQAIVLGSRVNSWLEACALPGSSRAGARMAAMPGGRMGATPVGVGPVR